MIFHLGAVTAIVSFFVCATYFFYPYLPSDFAFGYPAMAELREAWIRYGVIDFDFSPFRCLGLPAFSNPTSLSWSFFHLTALFFQEAEGLTITAIIFSVISYFGCVRWLRSFEINPSWVPLLSLGWSLQGFATGRSMAGHYNYIPFTFLPLFLWILHRCKPEWYLIGAFSFLWAQTIYTTAVYLIFIWLAGLMLASIVIRLLLEREDFKEPLASPLESCRTLLLAGFFSTLMTLPKVLAVLNFSALYPREFALHEVPTWNSFVFTLSHYFYPIPWNIQKFVGWWYGNWESYEFIFPLLPLFLIYPLWKNRTGSKTASFSLKVALLFFSLLLLGTLVSSGILAPWIQKIPILNSMHVNPRWNGIVFLPYFALIVGLIIRRKIQLHWASRGLLYLCFAGAPFLMFDKENMLYSYLDGSGLDRYWGRTSFCYEPMFGYQNEKFPLGKNYNPFASDLIDPRCYLKSYACTPGSLLKDRPDGTEASQLLKTYQLKESYWPVLYLKWPSLAVYALGFIALLISVFRIVRASLVDKRDNTVTR